MEKIIDMKTLNAVIEAACNEGRALWGWDDDTCMEFAAGLMSSLDNDGWKVTDV